MKIAHVTTAIILTVLFLQAHSKEKGKVPKPIVEQLITLKCEGPNPWFPSFDADFIDKLQASARKKPATIYVRIDKAKGTISPGLNMIHGDLPLEVTVSSYSGVGPIKAYAAQAALYEQAVEWLSFWVDRNTGSAMGDYKLKDGRMINAFVGVCVQVKPL